MSDEASLPHSNSTAPAPAGPPTASARPEPSSCAAPERPADPHKPFRRLMRKVRKKDQAACTELVQMFQTEIYRTVRLPLIGVGLQSVIDPMDICQSVFASFFARVVDGPYELREPNHVRQLLLTMARNKVTDETRRYMAQRRGHHRLVAESEDCLAGVAAEISTPSSIVGKRELLAEVRKHLAPDERHLMEQRAHGKDWSALAAEAGSTPEALRKKLERAIARVAEQLGLTA